MIFIKLILYNITRNDYTTSDSESMFKYNEADLVLNTKLQNGMSRDEDFVHSSEKKDLSFLLNLTAACISVNLRTVVIIYNKIDIINRTKSLLVTSCIFKQSLPRPPKHPLHHHWISSLVFRFHWHLAFV